MFIYTLRLYIYKYLYNIVYIQMIYTCTHIHLYIQTCVHIYYTYHTYYLWIIWKSDFFKCLIIHSNGNSLYNIHIHIHYIYNITYTHTLCSNLDIIYTWLYTQYTKQFTYYLHTYIYYFILFTYKVYVRLIKYTRLLHVLLRSLVQQRGYLNGQEWDSCQLYKFYHQDLNAYVTYINKWE